MSAESLLHWNADSRSGRAAPSNRTIEALIRRGLDSALARRLQAAGQTLDRLKQASDADLESLGLDRGQRAAVRLGGRAAIPSETLAAALWANRWTCCVCRQPNRPIVVHHINPWAQSRDHSRANLAVVCTDHHAHAHRRGDLEQNLTPERLKLAKIAWESAVRDLDAQSILAASRVQGHHWLWFNHRRLLETAETLGIDRLTLASFAGAYRRGYLDEEGRPRSGDTQQPYVAAGGDGDYLLAYLAEMFRAALSRSAVFNISDHLDRGFLARVVKPGDLILVQGRHVFKERTKRNYGPGQLMEVRRQANGVKVNFTIDRWEAIATSAWGSWLRGVQRVASVVRVNEVVPGERALELRCSGLAIGLALDGLSARSYAFGTWPEGNEHGDEDNWLDEVLKNVAMQSLYQDISRSYSHLDGYLSLFAPLNRRLSQSKASIRGEDIYKYLSELLGERMQRHSVSLVATDAFKNAEVHELVSIIYPPFVNIVDNAFYWLTHNGETSPDSGTLKSVHLDFVDGAFVISDSGPGIFAADQDAVFQSGFSRKPGGSGLGLYGITARVGCPSLNLLGDLTIGSQRTIGLQDGKDWLERIAVHARDTRDLFGAVEDMAVDFVAHGFPVSARKIDLGLGNEPWDRLQALGQVWGLPDPSRFPPRQSRAEKQHFSLPLGVEAPTRLAPLKVPIPNGGERE